MPASSRAAALVVALAVALPTACVRQGFDLAPRPREAGEGVVGDAAVDSAGDVRVADGQRDVTADVGRDGITDGPFAAPCSVASARTWRNVTGAFDIVADGSKVRVYFFQAPGGAAPLLNIESLGSVSWKLTYAGAQSGPLAAVNTGQHDAVMVNFNNILWQLRILADGTIMSPLQLGQPIAAKVAIDHAPNGETYGVWWANNVLTTYRTGGTPVTKCLSAQAAVPASLAIRTTATRIAVAQSLSTRVVLDYGALASWCAGGSHVEVGKPDIDVAVAVDAVGTSGFAAFYPAPDTGGSANLTVAGALPAPTSTFVVKSSVLAAAEDGAIHHLLAASVNGMALKYVRVDATGVTPLWATPTPPPLPTIAPSIAIDRVRAVVAANALHVLVKREDHLDYVCMPLP